MRRQDPRDGSEHSVASPDRVGLTRGPGRCRPTLTINNSSHDVRLIVPGDNSMLKAFCLTRDGHISDVALHPYGPTLECPDFIFRRDGPTPRAASTSAP